MHSNTRASKIRLLDFRSPQMRTFHVTWLAFFLCFFGWFGIAPLMPYVREEFGLSKEQVGNLVIASVAMTVFARILIGWLCDRIGPRITYAGLLMIGAFPVGLIGLAHDYTSLLFFRLAIGLIGAAFVITQYHTSVMFAPNIVGTANATTAGWGNLGGGITNMCMPLAFAGIAALGFSSAASWRLAMIAPGILLFLAGIAYLKLTQDTPAGNFADLKRDHPKFRGPSKSGLMALGEAVRDPRTWGLAVAYGACFGVELTIHNIAALYFTDTFTLDAKTAGLVAGSFGVVVIFARTLGGWLGDFFGRRHGLRGRSLFLAGVLACEGVLLFVFASMSSLGLAIGTLVLFGIFVHMSAGATYSVVPFVNRRAVGAVSGIVGAGGNIGAVAAGLLFRGGFSYSMALTTVAIGVLGSAAITLLVRFSPEEEAAVAGEMEALMTEQAL